MNSIVNLKYEYIGINNKSLITFREVEADIKYQNEKQNITKFDQFNDNKITRLEDGLELTIKYFKDFPENPQNKFSKRWTDTLAKKTNAENELKDLRTKRKNLQKNLKTWKSLLTELIKCRDFKAEIFLGKKTHIMLLNTESDCNKFNNLSTKVIREKAHSLIKDLSNMNFSIDFDPSKISFPNYCKLHSSQIEKNAQFEKEISSIRLILANRFIHFDNFSAKMVLEKDINPTLDRKIQKDTTGIATNFVTIQDFALIQNGLRISNIEKEHLNTKLQILIASLKFVENNKKILKENKFFVYNFHKANKTNIHDTSASKVGYENAHISLIPQIYMKKVGQNETYKLSNSTIKIDLKDCKGNSKHIETSLDKLFNCTNFAPKVINDLDSRFELYVRTVIVNCFNKIIDDQIDSNDAYKEILHAMRHVTLELDEYLRGVSYLVHRQKSMNSHSKTNKHYFTFNDRNHPQNLNNDSYKSAIKVSDEFLLGKIVDLGTTIPYQLNLAYSKLQQIIYLNSSILYRHKYDSSNCNLKFYTEKIIQQLQLVASGKLGSNYNFDYAPDITKIFINIFMIVDSDNNPVFLQENYNYLVGNLKYKLSSF